VSATATRIAVEQGLESLPAIKHVIDHPAHGFDIIVRSRDAMARERPDIVLLMASGDDSTALRDLLAADTLPRRAKIVLVTSVIDPAFHEEAIIQGVSGVLDKWSSAALVLKALHCIARGELWVDRQTTGAVFERLSRGLIRKKWPLSLVAVH
jgi:DNA-binding NarL/FixJ family response regulator